MNAKDQARHASAQKESQKGAFLPKDKTTITQTWKLDAITSRLPQQRLKYFVPFCLGNIWVSFLRAPPLFVALKGKPKAKPKPFRGPIFGCGCSVPKSGNLHKKLRGL